jgi:hypothetical protein
MMAFVTFFARLRPHGVGLAGKGKGKKDKPADKKTAKGKKGGSKRGSGAAGDAAPPSDGISLLPPLDPATSKALSATEVLAKQIVASFTQLACRSSLSCYQVCTAPPDAPLLDVTGGGAQRFSCRPHRHSTRCREAPDPVALLPMGSVMPAYLPTAVCDWRAPKHLPASPPMRQMLCACLLMAACMGCPCVTQALHLLRLLPNLELRLQALVAMWPAIWDRGNVADLVLDLDHPVALPLLPGKAAYGAATAVPAAAAGPLTTRSSAQPLMVGHRGGRWDVLRQGLGRAEAADGSIHARTQTLRTR